MTDDIEARIARAEREYERVTNAAFIARTRVRSLSTDSTTAALELARARAQLESLEKKRAVLRSALDALEEDSPLG